MHGLFNHTCQPGDTTVNPSESASQTASQSVQFLSQTQTMEGVMSTAKGRIYAMYAMQPNTIECLLQRAQ